ARWLNRQKALIQLSFRYKTDDQLWFTFFHEAAHVLGGYQSSAFIDNFEPNDLASEVELEADRFAADILVPPTEYRKFTEGIQGGRISRNKVSAFAKSIGVAPGIVVGRLQHDGLLPYTHLNGLKVRLKWPT
ncbi:MAG TPA: ImmA/IrrE family metallo-endopeptidase, partial [Bacillota bacterium]|nr:ImmA/IrrE family metallo-endopeptidase [Bacillota bacterium]